MVDYRQLFKNSLKKYKNHTKWDDGDFRGIKTVSNTSVGNVGQDFIAYLCNAYEIENTPNKIKDSWDIEILGVKFEVKTASEDTSGRFQFDHVRYHREYDAVLCLGVSPNELFFNVWTKQNILIGREGKLASMEKDANASFKLSKSKKELWQIEHFSKVILEFIRKVNEDNQRSEEYSKKIKTLIEK